VQSFGLHNEEQIIAKQPGREIKPINMVITRYLFYIKINYKKWLLSNKEGS
jgi:hypothetical protein